ncbi:MAG: WG repeat-containing protein [Bacteroidales bacterium]|nr:WG repeat-containing protein [Bacteroidales bacterium]
MKRIFAITILLIPLWVAAQQTQLSPIESAQRIKQLQKILPLYDARYDNFNYLPDYNLVIVRNDFHLSVIDMDGKVLLDMDGLIVRQIGTQLFLVMNEEKIGLVDKQMHWRIPLKYDHDIECFECIAMDNYFSGNYALVKQDGKYGAIDTLGRTVVPFIFDSPFGLDKTHQMLHFSQYDTTPAQEWITDLKGNTLIGPYTSIGPFVDGLAAFSVGERYGFINTKGEIAIPLQYDYAWGFKNGLSVVIKDGQHMLIDQHGNVKLKLNNNVYFEHALWNNKVIIVHQSDNNQYGAIDLSGKQLIQPHYLYWYTINNNYIAMHDEKEACDIYDRNGHLVKHFQQFKGVLYDDGGITNINDGFFAVMKDSLWGIVDSNFNTVLPFRCEDATYLGYGCFRMVGANGKTTFVDTKGKPICDGPYDDIYPQADGLYKFYTANPDNYEEMIVGYIDRYGNSTATLKQLKQMKAWQRRHP